MFRRTRNKKYIANPTWYSNLKKDFDNQFDKNFEFSWIPFKNKIVLHTDRLSEEELTLFNDFCSDRISQNIENQKFNHNTEISWRYINKYAQCTTLDEMKAVNPDFMTDLTSEGIWIYPLPCMFNANHLFDDYGYKFKLNNFDIDISHMTNIDYMFQHCHLKTDTIVLNHPTITSAISVFQGDNSRCGFYKKVILNLPNATNIISICWHHAAHYLKEVEGDLNSVKYGNNAFFGPYGHNEDALTIFKPELPSLSDGTGMFNRQALDKDSTLRILNSIPSYDGGTHQLMIGIHKDYKTDEEVLTAITNAEEKGWTLTVQWNGRAGATGTTTTTSSYTLRKIVYAKLGEIENPNGEKESFLDWGHYVTNWEENGYQEFSSLEEAYEHFNLEFPKETIDNSQIS